MTRERFSKFQICTRGGLAVALGLNVAPRATPQRSSIRDDKENVSVEEFSGTAGTRALR